MLIIEWKCNERSYSHFFFSNHQNFSYSFFFFLSVTNSTLLRLQIKLEFEWKKGRKEMDKIKVTLDCFAKKKNASEDWEIFSIFAWISYPKNSSCEFFFFFFEENPKKSNDSLGFSRQWLSSINENVEERTNSSMITSINSFFLLRFCCIFANELSLKSSGKKNIEF